MMNSSLVTDNTIQAFILLWKTYALTETNKTNPNQPHHPPIPLKKKISSPKPLYHLFWSSPSAPKISSMETDLAVKVKLVH